MNYKDSYFRMFGSKILIIQVLLSLFSTLTILEILIKEFRYIPFYLLTLSLALPLRESLLFIFLEIIPKIKRSPISAIFSKLFLF